MRIVHFLLALCCAGAWTMAYAQSAAPQSQPDLQPQLHQRTFPDFTGVELEPRCALITDLGPQFGPLVNACQYALTPEALPNVVCQETVERSARGFHLDTITAEVTLLNGVDHYSNFTVNGKAGTPDWRGGWGSNALFGGVLKAVFFPKNKTTFKVAKDSTTTQTGFSHYEFNYPENHSPGFNVAGENPAMTGNIWVNRSTGQLARMENISVPTMNQKRLQSYHSVIDYVYMAVPQLGLILFPSKAAVQVCLNNSGCFQNVATFHDCRKFGSDSRIVPDSPQ
jgi:hypothetical protein